jgi:tetratricopeptide (TPR) repeat protein
LSRQPEAASTTAEQAWRNQTERQRPAAEQLRLVYAVARGYLAAGALDDAETWLDKKAAAVPDQPRTDSVEGRTRVQLLRGDVCFARSQRVHEPAVQAQCIDAAIEAYRKAQQLSPDDVTAANNLAWLLAHERHDGQAAYALVPVLRRSRSGEVLSGDGLSLQVLDTLGVVYAHAGHAAEAVQLFEEATSRYRGEPSVYLHLARSYAALGDSAKAQATGEAALSFARARAAASRPLERARWEQQVTEIRGQLAEWARR